MERHIKFLVALSLIMLVAVPAASAFTFKFGNININIGSPDRVDTQPQDNTGAIQTVQDGTGWQDQSKVSERIQTMNTADNRAYLDGVMERHNITSVLYTVDGEQFYYVRGQGLKEYTGQQVDIEIIATEKQTNDMLNMAEDRYISFMERIRMTSIISKMDTQGMPKLSIFGSW